MTVRTATNDDQLAAVYAIRREVFIDEQGVSEADELDEHDATAVHYLAIHRGTPVACGRIVWEEDGSAHIGRLAVRKPYRSRGYGGALCQFMVLCAKMRKDCHTISLGAQLHAVGFYEKLGFVPVGDVFLDAGIEHRRMEITL